MGVMDDVRRNAVKAGKGLERLEGGAVRSVLGSYDTARDGLMVEVLEKLERFGDAPTAAQITQLLSDVSLIESIGQRLAELERVLGEVVRAQMTDGALLSWEAAMAELNILRAGMGLSPLLFVVDPFLEALIAPAVGQVPGLVGAVKMQLVSELQTGLFGGEGIRTLVRRVFSKQPGSIVPRGKTSAELFVRRAVNQVGNGARQGAMREVKERVPELKRQALAFVSGGTTKTCLAVHGQIVGIDEPFLLTHEPRFARKMMSPPFHWNCRTTVVPYLAEFEDEAVKTTSDLRAEARKELNAR